MRSSTIWTTAWNLTDLSLNYHTQLNRRLRTLEIKKIDFSKTGDEIMYINLDDKKRTGQQIYYTKVLEQINESYRCFSI